MTHWPDEGPPSTPAPDIDLSDRAAAWAEEAPEGAQGSEEENQSPQPAPESTAAPPSPPSAEQAPVAAPPATTRPATVREVAPPPPPPATPPDPAKERLAELAQRIKDDFGEEAIDYIRLTAEAAASARMREVEAQFQALVHPFMDSHRRNEEQRHLNAIQAAHPDARQLVQDGSLEQWVGALASWAQPAARQVIQGGTAEQIIALLADFKRSRGVAGNQSTAGQTAKLAAGLAVRSRGGSPRSPSPTIPMTAAPPGAPRNPRRNPRKD